MLQRGLITILLLSGVLYPMGEPPPNYDNMYDEAISDEVMDGAVTVVSQPIARVAKFELSNLKLKSHALEENIIKKANGEEQKKYTPIKETYKGGEVVYINTIANSSSSSGKNIVVKNPIPQGTRYDIDSARCGNGCSIYYSKDNGQSLEETNSDGNIYNYIEFHFETVPPKKIVKMGFRVIVN